MERNVESKSNSQRHKPKKQPKKDSSISSAGLPSHYFTSLSNLSSILMNKNKSLRFKSLRRTKLETETDDNKYKLEKVIPVEDLLGKDIRYVTFEVIGKINSLSTNFRNMIQNAKLLSRSHEGHLYNVTAFLQTGEQLSSLIQRGMPASRTAYAIKKATGILNAYETEKFRDVTESLTRRLNELEYVFDQTLSRIKNYTRAFSKDEKERLEVVKSAKSAFKKVSKNSKDSSKEKTDLNNACFDLKSLREDNLRRVLTDYNFINSAFISLYLMYIKTIMKINYSFRYEAIRDHLIDMEDLVYTSNSVPDDLEYLMKNSGKYAINAKTITEINEVLTDEEPLFNKEKMAEQNVTFFNTMKPLDGHIKKAFCQYLGAQPKELDLAEKDIIICYTSVYDGWQYGLNITSYRRGWFPVSFTEDRDDKKFIDKANNLLREYHCPLMEYK